MRPSPGVPDMSAAVIIMTGSGPAEASEVAFIDRQEVPGVCLCTSHLGIGQLGESERVAARSARQERFFFFFLLNTKPSEERRPAVTQSWEAGLWNVLQEYPDSASSGSQLLMRLLTADPVSPPAEGQRSAGIAHPVSRPGRDQIRGEVPACCGGSINTGVTLICCQTVLAAGSFL